MIIEILGDPVALRRPRFSNGVVYNSQAGEMRTLSFVARSQVDGTFDSQVSVDFMFFFKFPKRKPKTVYKATKPDIDNLVKYYLDVLVMANIISDDNIVVKLSAQKLYSDRPSTRIIIEEI